MNISRLKGEVWWKQPFAFATIWVVLVNTFAYIAANRMNLSADTAYTWLSAHEFVPGHSWNPVPMHVRWDGNWYLSIVEQGYEFHGAGEFANLVFFPLYPFITKVAGVLLGGNYGAAGWLVSALSLVAASVMLFRLVRDFHPTAEARLTIIALLLFPTAFFFSLVYTEALFLFLSVSSIYYARQHRWWVAGAIGILAALTRVTGVLLLVPLVWEYARANDFNVRRMLKPAGLGVLLPALGTVGFFTFHYVAFGSFLIFFELQRVWGRSFSYNPEHFQFFSHAATTNTALDISFVVLAVLAVVWAALRVRLSYALYMAATIAMALGSGTTMSIGRYLLVLFPLYIAFATVKNEYVRWAWLLFSGLLMAMYTILFIHGHWAG